MNNYGKFHCLNLDDVIAWSDKAIAVGWFMSFEHWFCCWSTDPFVFLHCKTEDHCAWFSSQAFSTNVEFCTINVSSWVLCCDLHDCKSSLEVYIPQDKLPIRTPRSDYPFNIVRQLYVLYIIHGTGKWTICLIAAYPVPFIKPHTVQGMIILLRDVTYMNSIGHDLWIAHSWEQLNCSEVLISL